MCLIQPLLYIRCRLLTLDKIEGFMRLFSVPIYYTPLIY
nr:MAG TPA: hypothetical protein [Caudoviricetes sp.]